MDTSKPNYMVTRLFAIAALCHFFWYSNQAEPKEFVVMFDLWVIFGWMLGSNGREALVSAVQAWAGKK